MKKTLVVLMALGVLMVFSGTAQSTTITYSADTAEDILVNWTSLSNSGVATEAAWLAAALHVDPADVLYTKLDNSGGDNWMQVTGVATGDDLWAYDFMASDFEYFLIKTATNTYLDGELRVSYNVFLYQNLPSVQYGVIDLDDYYRLTGNGSVRDIEICRVSHVGGAATTSVPEPGTLLLLGSGLFGLGILRRAKNRS